MSKLFSILIVFILFLGSNETQGQSRVLNNDGMVLDRSIGAGTRYNTPRKTSSIDVVKTTVDALTEKLKLDGFQVAILQKIVSDYNEKALAATEESIPNEAKLEKINIEKAAMDVKITEILTDKQKVAFIELKKTNREKREGRKSSKKRKKSSESEESDSDMF